MEVTRVTKTLKTDMLTKLVSALAYEYFTRFPKCCDDLQRRIDWEEDYLKYNERNALKSVTL